VRLAAHGISVDLPRGWEGTIARERDSIAGLDLRARGRALPEAAAAAVEQSRVFPVAHLATFPLPAARNDFGANAVERMGKADVFVSLLEYDPIEADSPLFEHRGLPRRLDPRRFSARQLQRTLPGQAGFQLFFNEGGRAFCLYVVLGDADDAHRLVRRVEAVLAKLRIEMRR